MWYDWQAALLREQRSVRWLAKRTGVHPMTVYRYKWGTRQAPEAWVKSARRALEGHR